MTTCPPWTTTTCAEAVPPCTRPMTRPPPSWWATPSRPWPSRCWPIRRPTPDPAIRSDLVLGLARASGLGGMVGGQLLDLSAEGRYGPAELDGGRYAPAPDDEDRRDPHLLGGGGRDPGPGRCGRPPEARRVRARARRGLPGGGRHPRPGGLARRRSASARARTRRRARPPSSTCSGWRARAANAASSSRQRRPPSTLSAPQAQTLREAVRFVVERQV